MAPKKRSRLPEPPDLPEFESCEVRHSLGTNNAENMEQITVRGGSSKNLTIKGLKIRESAFFDHDLSESSLPFLELADLQFDSCTAANAEWHSVHGSRIAWKSCRLTGLRCNDAEFNDLLFQDCMMEYAQMRFSKLCGAWFERCSLRHADFSGSDLTGATFSDCDLTGVSLSEAICSGMDVRSSILDGLVMGVQQLPGLIINPLQAVEIAKVAGTIVLDSHEDLPETSRNRRH